MSLEVKLSYDGDYHAHRKVFVDGMESFDYSVSKTNGTSVFFWFENVSRVELCTRLKDIPRSINFEHSKVNVDDLSIYCYSLSDTNELVSEAWNKLAYSNFIQKILSIVSRSDCGMFQIKINLNIIELNFEFDSEVRIAVSGNDFEFMRLFLDILFKPISGKERTFVFALNRKINLKVDGAEEEIYCEVD